MALSYSLILKERFIKTRFHFHPHFRQNFNNHHIQLTMAVEMTPFFADPLEEFGKNIQEKLKSPPIC